jgi:hypothetical protein
VARVRVAQRALRWLLAVGNGVDSCWYGPGWPKAVGAVSTSHLHFPLSIPLFESPFNSTTTNNKQQQHRLYVNPPFFNTWNLGFAMRW